MALSDLQRDVYLLAMEGKDIASIADALASTMVTPNEL